MASRPYSIHAVGLQYNKSSEGYGYGAETEPGSEVQPNETYTYSWYIPEDYARSRYYCMAKTYFSTVDPLKDLNSGLVGPLVICKYRFVTGTETRDSDKYVVKSRLFFTK